jgi:P4 family phage/plasmid primase-like protien
MWEHLASCLTGSTINQTFNMYIGHGQNGKSVLVNLMEMILGDYKGDVPLSVITDKRGKVGGLAPEVVALRGVRYAVMQEPSKGDKINEGVMKQLTSGIDPIQARSPYMTNFITFIPQFHLVVCSNEFMEIKARDHGTWRRIRVVEFEALFTDNPVKGDTNKPYQFKLDKDLKEKKFSSWKHVFMAMLVEKAFITDGVVIDCEAVMKASNSYKESQDCITEFIREKTTKKSNNTINKNEINNEFVLWYQMNYGNKPPKLKEVHGEMDKIYGNYDKLKLWNNVCIIYDNTNKINKNDENVEMIDEHDISIDLQSM